MKTKRLAVIVSCATSLVLMAGCREPNAQHSQSRAASPDSKSDAARPTTLCNIEAIGGQLLGADPVVLDSPAGVKGWLADSSGASLTDPRLVMVDSKKRVIREVPIQVSRERPDVVKAYPGKKGLEKSGFEADLDSVGLQPQTYHLYLAYSVESVSYSCDNGRYVEVL